MGHSSDSDYSRSSSSRRKKKSSRKRRSRTPSHDDGRRSRRKSRSQSVDSERGSKRKRSRSRDRSFGSRSRDSARRRSRSKSPVRRKKHVDAVLGVSTGTMKDIMDILPGFSKMAPAEQSRIRIQRALNAAVESSAAQTNVEIESDEGEEEEEEEEMDVKEQIERAKAIQAIGDDEDDDGEGVFLPSHFRSSKKSKKKLIETPTEPTKKTFIDRENYHQAAIFGHSSLLTMDEAVKQKKETDDEALFKAKKMVDFTQRDPKSLLAPGFLVTAEQAAARWRSKLISLRQRFSAQLAT